MVLRPHIEMRRAQTTVGAAPCRQKGFQRRLPFLRFQPTKLPPAVGIDGQFRLRQQSGKDDFCRSRQGLFKVVRHAVQHIAKTEWRRQRFGRVSGHDAIRRPWPALQ